MNTNRTKSKEAVTSVLIVLFLSAFCASLNFGNTGNRWGTAGRRGSPKAPAQGLSNVPSSFAPATGRSAVLVELFTSEGCNTCPPADKLLTVLDQTQPIDGAQVIALSEHVDYWNRLGWKDPFSSAEFTQRQVDYEKVFNVEGPYTPQMVVDGHAQFVGSRVDSCREAITAAERSPKADVSIAIKTSAANSVALTVKVENVPEISHGDSADVMVAITESGLSSNVLRGENAGQNLVHSAVTRKLFRIGSVDHKGFSAEKTVSLASNWKRANMKAVVFIQERASRHVIGAAAIGLGEEPSA
ncbi:MAG: DUF1223 domain-containing protein [Blastocatellia bacterium]